MRYLLITVVVFAGYPVISCRGYCPANEVPCQNPPCQERSCAPGNPYYGKPYRSILRRNQCYCPYGNLRNSLGSCIPAALCDYGYSRTYVATQPYVNNYIQQPIQYGQTVNPYQPVVTTVNQPYQPWSGTYQPYHSLQPYQPITNIYQPYPTTVQQPYIPNQAIIQPASRYPYPVSITTVNQVPVPPMPSNNPFYATILTDLGPEPLLYQLYQKILVDHFYTRSVAEAVQAVRLYGYDLEMVLGRMPANPSFLKIHCPFLVPLQRWYSAIRSDHYYTTSQTGAAKLKTSGYRREPDTGYCVNGMNCGATLPLHQFYNNLHGDHYYTTHQFDFLHVISGKVPGYVYEGVVCHIWG